MPNTHLYIILTPKIEKHRISSVFVALLIVLSLITFPVVASAIETKEQIAETYRAKGYTEYQEGNLNAALEYYIKAINLGMRSAVVYNDIGILYEKIGRFGRAERYYRQAIQIDGGYLPAYTNLAYFYLDADQPDKALPFLVKRYEMASPGDPWAEQVKEQILKINPAYKDWMLSMEAKHLEGQIVEQERREFYARVQQAQEHYLRGLQYHKDKQYGEAIDEYDKALIQTPENPQIIEARQRAVLEESKQSIKYHANLAVKRLEAGDSDSAKSEIRKMLTTIPNE